MNAANHQASFRTRVFSYPFKNSPCAMPSLKNTEQQAPGLSSHERIEGILRDEVHAARERYMNSAQHSDEFARALKRFSAFVIAGTIPEDLKPSTGV